MLTKDKLFQTGDTERIWQKYCGFLDLSLGEFMEIQEHLLLDEIELVTDSPLGKKIMNNQRPTNTEEFRRLVPLTSYEDYAPYIGDCQEDYLALKPFCWAHTSGRGGSFKWVPYTERALERHADANLVSLFMASANRRGDVKVKEGDRILSILAPRPYISGLSAWALTERFNLRVIPPLEISEKMEFQERIEEGFKMALRTGVDFIGSVSTPLAKMGERFEHQQSQGMKFSPFMLHPAVLSRLLRAWLRCKMQRRAMLPSDLWSAKGLACGGTDTILYKEKLEYYWGRSPHEAYGATETGLMATQSWAKKGMTFYPYIVFFEFIPEEEWLKGREDKEYQPSTVLLNEVEAGKVYEVVTTSFYGMPFLRYRLGDLVKIISLKEETGIKLPQMTFKARADDIVDVYGIARLDERTVWQAIVNTGVEYEDWSMRKEYEGDKPIVRLYIEFKQEMEAQELEQLLHEQLKGDEPLYNEAIEEMRTNPIRVTILPRGGFQHYYEEKRKAGADLAHLKPPHMNASDAVIQDLLRLSGGGE